MPTAKTHHLIENRQRIAHGTIRLLCNYIQSFGFSFNTFATSHILQMFYNISHTNAIEIIDLTTRKNGWNNFMFFGRCQHKNSVCWWLFQCFQKGIKSRSRQHVNLIDDIDTIFTNLRRNTHLVN